MELLLIGVVEIKENKLFFGCDPTSVPYNLLQNHNGTGNTNKKSTGSFIEEGKKGVGSNISKML